MVNVLMYFPNNSLQDVVGKIKYTYIYYEKNVKKLILDYR